MRVCQPAITSRPTVTYPARSRTEEGDRFTIIFATSPYGVGRSPNIARRFFGKRLQDCLCTFFTRARASSCLKKEGPRSTNADKSCWLSWADVQARRLFRGRMNALLRLP